MKLKTLNLLAGICLLVVTIIEVFEERKTLEIEIEHGLLIYAIAHVLNGAVEMYEGIRKIKEHRSLKE
ncbi:MAG TPA: hypothetical protein VI603_13180 [Saprospiraceae bacterium]|nr:hypothetical protein [Saprospiraceae bacterium]